MVLWGSLKSAAVLRSEHFEGCPSWELIEMKTISASKWMGPVGGGRGDGVRLSAGRRPQAKVWGRGATDGDWAPQPESLQGESPDKRSSRDALTNIIGQTQPWPLTA